MLVYKVNDWLEFLETFHNFLEYNAEIKRLFQLSTTYAFYDHESIDK